MLDQYEKCWWTEAILLQVSANLWNKLALSTDSTLHLVSGQSNLLPVPNKWCLWGFLHRVLDIIANVAKKKKKKKSFSRGLLDSGLETSSHFSFMQKIIFFLISTNLVKPLIAHRKPWSLFQKCKQLSNLPLIYYLSGCWQPNSQ